MVLRNWHIEVFFHWPPCGQDVLNSEWASLANLDLAKKKRSALSLNSVGGRGVSCLWIGLLVFITSSCAGTEDRHTIPYPVLSVSGLSNLSHSNPEHQSASVVKGVMEKHTRLIAPYPNRSMGLVLKWERKYRAVWNSSHVSDALPSHYIVKSKYVDKKVNTTLPPQT